MVAILPVEYDGASRVANIDSIKAPARKSVQLSRSSSVAICTATDEGFAFPTAVVAKSISRLKCKNIGPVYYVWIGQSVPPRELVSYLERCGVILVVAPSSLLLTMRGAHGLLTPAASARLALAEILKDFPIDKFLYLDGDVEIAGSLSELGDVDLPEGQIAAADNAGTLISRRDPRANRQWIERIRNLGMPEGSSYFSSGVMLAHMQSWGEISAQARKYYAENPSKCRFFDQCALNAVCYNRRLILSPRWNFQSDFFNLNYDGDIRPAIVHFSGSCKPWVPVPFTRSWRAAKPFLAARSEMPELWGKTAQRGAVGIYKKTFANYIRRAKFRSAAQRIFSHYLATTGFADTV